eukprot:4942264-Heterocapsa_arctica.AAC.1
MCVASPMVIARAPSEHQQQLNNNDVYRKEAKHYNLRALTTIDSTTIDFDWASGRREGSRGAGRQARGQAGW